MKRRALTIGVAGLAACAQAAAPPTATTALDGEWRVTRLDGEAITGTARFRAGTFSISFGCNIMSGGYRIERDRLVPAYPMSVTEMACGSLGDGPDLMAIERRGFAAAARPLRIGFEQAREVRLSNEAGTIDLTR